MKTCTSIKNAQSMIKIFCKNLTRSIIKLGQLSLGKKLKNSLLIKNLFQLKFEK